MGCGHDGYSPGMAGPRRKRTLGPPTARAYARGAVERLLDGYSRRDGPIDLQLVQLELAEIIAEGTGLSQDQAYSRVREALAELKREEGALVRQVVFQRKALRARCMGLLNMPEIGLEREIGDSQ